MLDVLDQRLDVDDGTVVLSGLQALVRALLDQHRADAGRGLRTASLVSGYPGSPVAAFDTELLRERRRLGEHHVVFRPGVNEELAATAIAGAQLANSIEGVAPRYDGVLGMWFAKAPGLDRAADAIRHANLAGVGPTGGVVAVVGDDPGAKSSTIPSASEATLASMLLPVLYPGSVEEVLDLTLHAFMLSRTAGVWAGLKLVADVADALATVRVPASGMTPVLPESDYTHRVSGRLLPPMSLELEQTLRGPRLALVSEYARLNGLNRVTLDAPRARIGIVAAGKTYYELRQALHDIGLGDDDLHALGVRILKLGLVWPLDATVVRTFASGLERVLVVEEKQSFVEAQLKEHLYGVAGAPVVLGKRDAADQPLLPVTGDLDAGSIAAAAARVLGLDEPTRRGAALGTISVPARTPFYCSGCPHNRSTRAPGDALVGAGIGCHAMVLLMDHSVVGDVTGITQMGGEGANWVGMSPFVENEHFVQNVGEGTFFHSAQLALRFAVASDVKLTYKLLFNGAVAMTGGQRVEGVVDVPELTHLLAAEGVRKIVVTAEEPERYRGTDLAGIADVRPRDAIDDALSELRDVDGVTVLIHDERCAAEKRRLRRRGELPDPAERPWINRRVCEGCGDCGRASHCLSVRPVETEFGTKTTIHQPSCNTDFSCLEGDCPSFLLVEPRGDPPPRQLPAAPPSPDPQPYAPDDWTVRMVGVGGTGVVTVNRVLAVAAHLDGYRVVALDQTGLAQKGGQVVSDLRLMRTDAPVSPKTSDGAADLLLGFDALGTASARALRAASAERTHTVIATSPVPTGAMLEGAAIFPAVDAVVRAIGRRSVAPPLELDADALSEALFGDDLPSNFLLLGAALQAGLVPVTLASLEQAIRVNGVAVDVNLAAVAWGRAWVANRAAVDAAVAPPAFPAPAPPDAVARALADAAVSGDLHATLEVRAADLAGFQNEALAKAYVAAVLDVRSAAGDAVAAAFAAGYHKLLAYKDEYEVARLHLDAAERARRELEFGAVRVSYLLHPPLLRSAGLKRKLRLGPWIEPVFRLLVRSRRLRGTPFDPFGYARVRRVERALPGEYRAAVDRAIAAGAPEELLLELAALPDRVRGYEEIKLRAVEEYRAELEALCAWAAEPAAAQVGTRATASTSTR